VIVAINDKDINDDDKHFNCIYTDVSDKKMPENILRTGAETCRCGTVLARKRAGVELFWRGNDGVESVARNRP